MSTWIAFSIFAALMQSVRTAGQKQLTSSLTPMSATLVRYLFGLPFVCAYLIILLGTQTSQHVQLALVNPRFVIYGVLASVAQCLAIVILR